MQDFELNLLDFKAICYNKRMFYFWIVFDKPTSSV